MGATPWMEATLTLFRERATFGCPARVALIGAVGTMASVMGRKTLDAYARARTPTALAILGEARRVGSSVPDSRGGCCLVGRVCTVHLVMWVSRHGVLAGHFVGRGGGLFFRVIVEPLSEYHLA